MTFVYARDIRTRSWTQHHLCVMDTTRSKEEATVVVYLTLQLLAWFKLLSGDLKTVIHVINNVNATLIIE